MQTNRKNIILGAIAALALVVLVGAGKSGLPTALGDALERIRPGITRHSTARVLDANTTSLYLTIRSGATVNACFPDRGTISVSAHGGRATCCLVLGTGITVGDQTTTAANFLTDATTGRNGQGACETIPASGTWTETIDLASLRQMTGTRSGVCSAHATADAVTGFRLRPPCASNADCTSHGAPAGTTCLASPTEAQWNDSCAFVVCRANTASTLVTARYTH